jgi:hypothetical protein
LGEWDSRLGAYKVKEGRDWLVSVSPMIFNDRVLLTDRQEYETSRYPCYLAGWCYDKGGAAVIAALAWDPDTEHRPVGFKKEAFDSR